MQSLLSSIYQAILEGDQLAAREAVQRALEQDVEAEIILKQAMMPAMEQVGFLFEEGEYFVPEMLVAARAMQTGLSLLKPKLVQADVTPTGKVVAGTVKGDLHDIGKNLVCMMLEGAAFEIIDLGTDVPPERFVEAVQSSGAQLVALSALLTTTMPNMKNTIEALQQAGLRGQVKVMVGGAPVTETFARQIGADGYAPDASRAVMLAKSLMGIS
ncbi:corrinoid protein [Bellilinea sp.]|uniref:corrinoid protein n=1 Tax=Bellilinea sp. TaxID=2838785 RepID=UPI002ADE56BD|nr:corrinoid protein [Bellilinea sp.]